MFWPSFLQPYPDTASKKNIKLFLKNHSKTKENYLSQALGSATTSFVPFSRPASMC